MYLPAHSNRRRSGLGYWVAANPNEPGAVYMTGPGFPIMGGGYTTLFDESAIVRWVDPNAPVQAPELLAPVPTPAPAPAQAPAPVPASAPSAYVPTGAQPSERAQSTGGSAVEYLDPGGTSGFNLEPIENGDNGASGNFWLWGLGILGVLVLIGSR